MSRRTFTVDEADIYLYPVDASGVADTASPLWLGEGAKNLRLTEELVEVIDRPTGVNYGEAHHVDESHTISIGKIFEVDSPAAGLPDPASIALGTNNPAENALAYKPRRGQTYVMVIVWQDQREANVYHHRCYFGVTARTNDLGGDVEGQIDEQMSFRAQYYI